MTPECEREVVRSLGKSLGYGNVMALAEQCWRELDAGGEQTVGPCAALLVPCPCTAPVECDWCCGTKRVTRRVARAFAEHERERERCREAYARGQEHAALSPAVGAPQAFDSALRIEAYANEALVAVSMDRILWCDVLRAASNEALAGGCVECVDLPCATPDEETIQETTRNAYLCGRCGRRLSAKAGRAT